jgi:hypothetical protein
MNLTGMSYKKKYNFLIAGILLLFIISYQFSIKKTVLLYQDCKEMQSKLKLIDEAPESINQIKNEIAQVDGMISSNDSSGTNFRELLLEKAGNFCLENNISIKEFPASVEENKNDYIIETNIIALEGSFQNLLKFTYNIEQKYKVGKVASVNFSSKYDIVAKKNKLTEKIYVQNIKKKNDEK